MANEIIDRIARALDPFIAGVACYDAAPHEYRDKCCSAARAVLEVMRDPDDHMLLMGGYGFDACRADNCASAAAHIWADMIEAALPSSTPGCVVLHNHFEIRRGDPPMFTFHADGRATVHMVGYHIVPMETAAANSRCKFLLGLCLGSAIPALAALIFIYAS